MIPQRGVIVGNWSGQGWMVLDEASGAAGYMICGGLHGANNMVNGGSSSIPVGLLIAKLFKFLYKIGDLFNVPGTALFVAGALIFAMTHFECGLVLSIVFPIIAMFMVCIALILIVIMWNNIWVFYPKRRKYSYA